MWRELRRVLVKSNLRFRRTVYRGPPAAGFFDFRDPARIREREKGCDELVSEWEQLGRDWSRMKGPKLPVGRRAVLLVSLCAELEGSVIFPGRGPRTDGLEIADVSLP